MLISLEGIDGSGKTTVWQSLSETVDGTVCYTREPTESWYGEAVRRSIADEDADPIAELFLYTADHAAHLADTIRPALETGDTVITDRYVDSRYAYQGTALEDVIPQPMEYVRSIHRPFTRSPDLTVLLELDPAVAVERSDAANKFERRAFLDGVARRYDRLAEQEPNRFVRVDASQTLETVRDRVIAVVRDALGSDVEV